MAKRWRQDNRCQPPPLSRLFATTPQMEEQELITLISKGNEMALGDFIDRYSSRLFYYAVGITGNKEMADEVVSDTFMELWNYRNKILTIDNLLTWMLTVAHNKAINYVRKEMKARKNIAIDSLSDFSFPEVQTPLNSMITQEEMLSLNRAIEMLPPKCKKVFFMAKIEKMKYSDIAQLMGITLPTVNYHIAFAMDSLKKLLVRKRN